MMEMVFCLVLITNQVLFLSRFMDTIDEFLGKDDGE